MPACERSLRGPAETLTSSGAGALVAFSRNRTKPDFGVRRNSGGRALPGTRLKAEQIVNELRQADVELASGSTVVAVRRLRGIAHVDQSYIGE